MMQLDDLAAQLPAMEAWSQALIADARQGPWPPISRKTLLACQIVTRLAQLREAMERKATEAVAVHGFHMARLIVTARLNYQDCPQ